jgi:hypothetical protein
MSRRVASSYRKLAELTAQQDGGTPWWETYNTIAELRRQINVDDRLTHDAWTGLANYMSVLLERVDRRGLGS